MPMERTPIAGNQTLQDVLTRMAILAAQKGACHFADPSTYPIANSSSLEAAFAATLARLSPTVQEVAKAAALKFAAEPAPTRATVLGAFAQINLRSSEPIHDQCLALKPFAGVVVGPSAPVPASMGAVHAPAAPPPPPAPAGGGAAAPPVAVPAANSIQFILDNVHCIQVTSAIPGEPLGGDDILISGTAIDNLGNVTQLAIADLGSFNNGDNDFGNASPWVPIPYVSMPIDTQSNWPKRFTVILSLAEKRSGGFDTFIGQLVNYVKQGIVDAATYEGGLVGAVAGALVGAPEVGGVLGIAAGQWIGQIIANIVGKVIQDILQWVAKEILGDWISTPLACFMDVMLGAAGWQPDFTFGWHNGQYEVKAHWKLAWNDLQVNPCLHASAVDLVWGGWTTELGGTLNFGPAAASWGEGCLDVFGIGTDDTLYHSWYRPSSGWTLWQPVGVPPGLTLISSPAAVAFTNAGSGAKTLYVAVLASDNAIWLIEGNGDALWSNWVSLGGVCTSSPGIAITLFNKINVFTLGTDQNLYINSATLGTSSNPAAGQAPAAPQGWSGWLSLGTPPNGVLTSGPAVASWSLNRMDLVARGSDNAVWHLPYDYNNAAWAANNGFGGWDSLGGTAASGPAIASEGENLLHVYVAGGAGQINEMYWNGNGWNSWNVLDQTVITSAPSAVSIAPRRIDIVARGR
jgi:hypothetical protein